jgi:hypothetical protein
MKIEKTTNGWLVEPDSADEAQALTYLLDALADKYARPVSTSTAAQASHSQPSAQSQNKAA